MKTRCYFIIKSESTKQNKKHFSQTKAIERRE